MQRVNSFDTLRAILTFCILIYHFLMVFFPHNLNSFKGGFLAVEVFFVLSGYLIVKMLISRKYNFLTFLWRRFLRLYPSLIFITISFLLIVHYRGYDVFNYVFNEFLYGILAIYNYFLVYAEIPYFDRFQKEMLFLPLWSLSIEIQLYIISGLVTKFIQNKKSLTWIFLFFVILSASISYIYFNLLNMNPDNIYYRTEARAYAYFIGGLLAVNEEKIKHIVSLIKISIKKIIFFISSVLLGLIFIYLDIYRDWFFPFGFLIVDFLSIIIIIELMQRDRYSKLLFKIGMVSYPMFLLHFPIFVLAKYSHGNFFIPFICLLIVFILSYSVHKLIEVPFRKIYQYKNLNYGQVILKILFSSGIIFMISLFTYYKPEKGVELIGYEKFTQESRIENEKLININKSDIQREEEKEFQNKESYLCKAFLIGDSVMLGAARQLASNYRGLIIDARVNRSFIEGLGVIKKNVNTIKKCENIVIHLGNNGYPRREFLEQIIRFIRENTREDINIFFVNLKGAKLSWEVSYNENLYSLREQLKIKIIDWYSNAKDEILHKDGIHLNIKGISVYTKMIAENLNLDSQDDYLIKSEIIVHGKDINLANRKEKLTDQEENKIEEVSKDIERNKFDEENKIHYKQNNKENEKIDDRQ